jgi:glycogen operon protein
MSEALGAVATADGTSFAVRAPRAQAVSLCLFDGQSEQRIAMRRTDDVWQVELSGNLAGARYGYRAWGEWAPGRGLWFDPAKLLIDPYAAQLDRRPAYNPRLSVQGEDTAALVPKAVVPGAPSEVPRAQPLFTRGGLVYELHVRGFTMRHPDVPVALRGTVAALAHPAIIAHLIKLHVSAVELMPVVSWIDERHLPGLGLTNFWGYNPVAPMALDPELCPGGMAELRATVATLHAAGIGVILDVVLNHTGESDAQGPVIGLRGLDDAFYGHEPGGALINDTGCGNTLDFAYPPMRELALATLRHFVQQAGVDGFRFDLATVLGRGPGFDKAAPFFAEIAADPWLADRVMIAEPWDIGAGGYQLGHFPQDWLEWNDRFRDDVRRFWRGDAAPGVLATRLAGSADVFGEQSCRSVNFLAAHDGFTLADTVAYAERHNEANGENNRDGHGENFSWNCGVEGPTDDAAIIARRAADCRALLGTLFASTGTIMLCAGDEFGRSQQGNNNAYCQDNTISWIDWQRRDRALEAHVAELAAWRAARLGRFVQFPRSGEWLRLDGTPTTAADWDNGAAAGFVYRSTDRDRQYQLRVDRDARAVTAQDGEPG